MYVAVCGNSSPGRRYGIRLAGDGFLDDDDGEDGLDDSPEPQAAKVPIKEIPNKPVELLMKPRRVTNM
ncbi:hypothetical protein PQR68_13360 [Paraburkholderia agricolaris]|uniref:hypothetical protein n=1 Tax=Paraburkholderia agricolaris TaxID=2152888 RepID=UPI0038B70C03